MSRNQANFNRVQTPYLLGVVIVMLGGCARSPGFSPTSPGDAITLTAPSRPASDQNNTQPAPTYRPWLRVDVFTFALSADLTDVWEHVSEDGLDEGRVRLWRDNGIRVGIIDADSRKPFLESLPQVVNHRAQVQTLSSKWARLIAGPPLNQPLPIVLVNTPDIQTHLQLSGGRCQMLVRMEEADEGMRKLEIAPHHHRVGPSIRVRTPEQIALEGRIFEELTLRAPLMRDEPKWLVIAWKPPPPPQAKQTTTSRDKPIDSIATTQPGKPAIPKVRRLGWPMLTGWRFNKALQRMVLISLDTSHPPTSTEASGDGG